MRLHRNSHGENDVGSHAGSPTPRWVKIFGIIAGILILLFVILHLAGFGLGGHTP